MATPAQDPAKDPTHEKPWDRFFRRAEVRATEKGITLNRSVEEDWGGTEEWLEAYLKPWIKTEHPVFCEVGPGTGRFTQHLIVGAKKYHLVDYSAYVCDVLRRDFSKFPAADVLQVSNCDLKTIAPGSVDFAFSIGTFVHLYLEQVYGYVREFARILKPGGHAVIHFANFVSEGGFAFFEKLVAEAGSPDRKVIFRFYHPEMVEFIARKCGLVPVSRQEIAGQRHAFVTLRK